MNNTLEPDRADVAAFLDMQFGYLDPGDENHAYSIALRGLGEKGTPGEGTFNNVQIIPPLRDGGKEVETIFGHVARWSANGRGAFIVPAAVSPAALSDPHATEDRILKYTTLPLDLDSGHTEKLLDHAARFLGEPSMVVHSGGTTKEGAPKLHAYWRFTEPDGDIAFITAARKLLALKTGGDAAFGRSTQIIRIPGSIYGKGGIARLCKIVTRSGREYDLQELLQAIEDMTIAQGIIIAEGKLKQGRAMSPQVYCMAGGGLNFTAFKEAGGDLMDRPDIEAALNTDIVEGGDEDRNRWGEFNRTAGFHINQARAGLIKIERAEELTKTWADIHMKPTWPEVRFRKEWRALVEVDIRNHGPMKVVPFQPAPMAEFTSSTTNPNINAPAALPMARNLDGSYSAQPLLADWDVSKLTDGEIPTRKFLVDGMIMQGKPHLLASEGGAGKTFLAIDLAVKIADHHESKLQSWCGLPLTGDAGGSVVMITTEDDKEEIHIRLAETFAPEVLERIKGKLVIFPTTNTGGAFPFVEKDRAQGAPRLGPRWSLILDQLRTIKNLKLVIIDTLNTTLHGTENDATVINEYVQAVASPICGDMGAAVIVTHHVRKANANQKVFTAEDMKNSIRGSTALVGGFRVVLGIWAAPDYHARLSAMGRDPIPGQLYNFAVCKANNPQMAFGVRALLRGPHGLLVDITDREQEMIAAKSDEVDAWLVQAIGYAANQFQPFTMKSLTRDPPNGRKNQLPLLLRPMSERKMEGRAKKLIEGGRLVQCNPKGRVTYNHLDIPGGPLAMAVGADGGGYTIQPGQDFEVPDWENLFAFHQVEGRIVPKGQERARTVGGLADIIKDMPNSQPRKADFNPNNGGGE